MLKQTRSVIAKETALIVFVILACCAMNEFFRQVEEAAKPAPWFDDPGPNCVSDGAGSVRCQYPREPENSSAFKRFR